MRDGAGCPTGDCPGHPTGAGDLTTLPDGAALVELRRRYRFYRQARRLSTLSTASCFRRFQNNKFIVGCIVARITENLLQRK